MVTVVVISGAGGAYWYYARGGTADAVDHPAGPSATATVTRETIAATERFDGTLGYGEPSTIAAGSRGTITAVAAENSAVARGTELYRLNEQPVTALFGEIPMYRDLAPGAQGVDVEQLEANLGRLGYGGYTVDDVYTMATADAVRAWQEDIGADESGVVGRADVVFVPEAARVDALHVDVGTPVNPGVPVLDLTGAKQTASAQVDVVDRALLAVGTRVTVELPDGGTVAGRVASTEIAATAQEGDATGSGQSASAGDAVVNVEVVLDKQIEGGLLGSPVEVVARSQEREDVLVVPVTALLAVAGGEYGLEVVRSNGSTSIIEVETGLFSEGKVEVSGHGIQEGTVVGVAGR